MGHRERPNATEPLRVLVVEDDDDWRELLAEVLRPLGCDVFTAATGEEALILAREQSIELALIDFGLPDMEGDELAPRLRSMPSSSRARLVGVSGDGSADRENRAKILGFDAVLSKPIGESQLVALVEEVLAKLAR